QGERADAEGPLSVRPGVGIRRSRGFQQLPGGAAEPASQASQQHDSWEEAWRAVFDVRGGDRVDRQAFVEGCQKLGLEGCPASADRLFELLDMDRVRYLTFAGTCWLGGIEEVPERPERECHGGDVVVSGAYKGITRSQARKLEDVARDNRLREARFEARGRAELARAGGAALSPARSEPSLALARPRRRSDSEGCIFPTSYVPQRVPLAPVSSLKARAHAPRAPERGRGTQAREDPGVDPADAAAGAGALLAQRRVRLAAGQVERPHFQGVRGRCTTRRSPRLKAAVGRAATGGNTRRRVKDH
ncbi:unnamed protein product, partial [Prorocentrum cordatum]